MRVFFLKSAASPFIDGKTSDVCGSPELAVRPARVMRRNVNLAGMFPPSPPCRCEVCRAYCRRPGWWTVEEAALAIEAGYAHRMMLEISPELTFGVLSPAFKGNEGKLAVQIFADQGCTFLSHDSCELFETPFRPLECRFCHHTRRGLGERCHAAIEEGWHSPVGQSLVAKWCKQAVDHS